MDIRKSSEASFALRKDVIAAYKETASHQFRSTIAQYGSFSPNQHRDTIRTFLCGWFHSLNYHKTNPENAVKLLFFHEQFDYELFSPEWWPGPEWRFWE